MKRKIILGTSFLLGLDQLTKFLVEHFLKEQVVVVFPNFFALDLVYNTGGAFSIFSKHTTLIVIASLFCFLFIKELESDILDCPLKMVTFSLLYGGILGNLVDRVFLGSVRDFLDFQFWGLHFPTFNVADIAIVVGMILLVLFLFGKKERIYENISGGTTN